MLKVARSLQEYQYLGLNFNIMACHLAHNLKLIDIMMNEHKLKDLLTIRSKSPSFKYPTDKNTTFSDRH